MGKLVQIVGFAVLLSGCGASQSSITPAKYENFSNSNLWYFQSTSRSAKQLAVVEAELGSRGHTRNGSYYLGSRTAQNFGRALYSRGETGGDNVANCSDFANSAAAQKFFLENGGPLSDPNDLDRDGDGFACEWGTTLQKSARAGRRAVARASRPRQVASSRCYVGPRGGTYTLTASGNKNYSGC